MKPNQISSNQAFPPFSQRLSSPERRPLPPRTIKQESELKNEDKPVIPLPQEQSLSLVQFDALRIDQKNDQKSDQAIPYTPSPQLLAFLESLHLTKEELKDISIRELDQLITQSWYGQFLNGFASNHIFFKLFAFWYLDERGIKLSELCDSFEPEAEAIALDPMKIWSQDFPKNFIEEIKSKDIQRDKAQDETPPENMRDRKATRADGWLLQQDQKSYLTRRVWPKNRFLLFESFTILARAYSVEEATNQLRWFNKIWAILLFSLLSNDIYFYYQYPERRYDNTLAKILFSKSEHSKMLSHSLTSVTIWPELIGIPILLATGAALWKWSHPTHAIPTEAIADIEAYWQHYTPTWKRDLLYPFLSWFMPGLLSKRLKLPPFPDSRYNLNNLLKTILWDGRVPAEDRIRLFEAAKIFLSRSAKLNKIALLTLFEELAENIHPFDIKRLRKAGYNRATAKALLHIQSQALAELKKYSRWRTDTIIFTIYAHFLLWNIGQPETKLLQPFFFIFQSYRWYATVNFFIVLTLGIQKIIEDYLAKKACENAGKLWIYMNQAADYQCTVCGDLPIYYGHVFTNEDCIRAWFETKLRPAQELIDFVENRIGRVDFSHITILNFNKQYLNGEDLAHFLRALEPRAVHLETLDLSMIRPKGFAKVPINSTALYALNHLLETISVQTLTLQKQFLGAQEAQILGQGLSNSSLQTLDLWGNTIGDEGAIGIGQGLNVSSLQTLYLGRNQIGAGGAIGIGQVLNVSSLQTLNLWGNTIGNEGAIGIGQALNASSLQTLDLRGNGIGAEGAKGIGQGLNASSLQTLDLSGNYIGDEGAKSIGQRLNTSSLQTLNLWGNSIGGEGAIGIGQGLNASLLQTLYLGHNHIGAEGAKGIGQALNVSSLQTLDLSVNSIGKEGAKGIGQALNTSSLQTLDLRYNQIGVDGAKVIEQGLLGSSLQTLDLGDNQIGAEGAKGIGQALNASLLQTLDLSRNYISAEGAKGIGQALNASSLQTLDLSGNYIGDEGAESIGQGLNTSLLQTLYLGGNQIGAEGAKGIGQGLNTSLLQMLDLSANSIGAEGAKGIGQGLPGSLLQTLNLMYDNIGDEGAKGIGQGLPGSFLQTLGLNDNGIGDEGAIGIGQNLPGSFLQTLDLMINNVGDEGAIAIGQGLPTSSLQTLDLSSNCIGDEGALAIANVLTTAPIHTNVLWIHQLDPDMERATSQSEPNTHLAMLDLRVNNITDAGAQAFCRVLPFSGMSLDRLYLHANPIDDPELMNYCEISAASSLELPLPFRLLGQFYRGIKEFIWPQSYHRNSGSIEEIEEKIENEAMVSDLEFHLATFPNSEIHYSPLLTLQSIQTQGYFQLSRYSSRYSSRGSSQDSGTRLLSGTTTTFTIPTLATFFLLGILLLYFYKKLFATEPQNPLMHHTTLSGNLSNKFKHSFFQPQQKPQLTNPMPLKMTDSLTRRGIL